MALKKATIRPLGPTGALCLGLALLYIGERSLHGTAQKLAVATGLTAGVGAMLAAIWRARRQAPNAPVYASIAKNFGMVAVGMAIYGCLRCEVSPPLFGMDPARAQTILRVSFVPIILWGLLPALAQERVAASAAPGLPVDLWRAHLAQRAARICVLGLLSFASINYAASVYTRRVDLSYFKTTQASQSTADLVRNLATDVRITLFFPSGNEVFEQVVSYLQPLALLSSRLHLQVADQALEPDRARSLQVRSNGFVTFEASDHTEVLRTYLDLEQARAVLRSLDTQLRACLLKVLQPGRIAYLTTGHGERDFVPQTDDARSGLADFKRLLEQQGFAVRRLGLAEGLSQAVPQDAGLVVIAGPLHAWGAMESGALHAYLQGGGRLLAALDPDHGSTLDAVLAPLGVRCSKALVGHDTFLVRVPGRRQSPYDLITNQTADHPASRPLAQSRGRTGVVLLGSGSVQRREGVQNKDQRLAFILHAMPESFLDKRGTGRFEGDPASRQDLELAAAIAQTQRADGSSGLRALVLCDADVIGDDVLTTPGNAAFIKGSLAWLSGETEATQIALSEDDVPLVHRKQDDVLWFYGVSFVMPALVAACGYKATRRRQRRRPSREVRRG